MDGIDTAALRRTQRVHDQAILATHDRLNGVMRSQMDGWRVPKTSRRQNVLHATSHIVDTVTRQKIVGVGRGSVAGGL